MDPNIASEIARFQMYETSIDESIDKFGESVWSNPGIFLA